MVFGKYWMKNMKVTSKESEKTPTNRVGEFPYSELSSPMSYCVCC